MRLIPATLLTALTLLLVGACGGDDDEFADADRQATSTATAPAQATAQSTTATTAATQPPATSTADPAAAEAVAVVESFDPADLENGIHRLNEVIYQDGNVVPALAPLLADEDPSRRWAALYVIAIATDTPAEIAILTPMLEDPALELRVSAAGSLSGLGVVASLPILIEALNTDAQLPYSHPPRLLADLAREALTAYTGAAFETADEWQRWWDANQDALRWDGTRYVAS